MLKRPVIHHQRHIMFVSNTCFSKLLINLLVHFIQLYKKPYMRIIKMTFHPSNLLFLMISSTSYTHIDNQTQGIPDWGLYWTSNHIIGIKFLTTCLRDQLSTTNLIPVKHAHRHIDSANNLKKWQFNVIACVILCRCQILTSLWSEVLMLQSPAPC
jgi:hypothetical protein